MKLKLILDNPIHENFTTNDIVEIHEYLRLPFKVHGNVKEILSQYPKYIVMTGQRHFEGEIVAYNITEGDNEGYVVFEPNKDEFNRIELWHLIEEIHKLLVRLRISKDELTKTDNSWKKITELKNEINQLISTINSLNNKYRFMIKEINETANHYSLKNTHIRTPIIQSIPPNDKQLKSDKEFKEKIKQEGKRLVTTCCVKTKKILDGALEIGLSELEFNLFFEQFNEHELTEFSRNKYTNIGGINITALIDEAFEAAELFESPEIRKYYLQSIYDNVQELNNSREWAKPLLTFNKQFPLRLKEWEQSQSQNTLKVKNNKKISTISFIELFRMNEDRMNNFFQLLKRSDVNALDNNNKWVYNERKSSIVACFQALDEKEYIKKGLTKSKLRRGIENEISFEGNEKLFRNPFNEEDYQYFSKLFDNHLK